MAITQKSGECDVENTIGSHLEPADPMESKILSSLRYCKGVTYNSMLSILVPSYDQIDRAIDILNSMKVISKKNWDELCVYSDTSKDDTHDPDRLDYLYACKVYEEASNFIKGIRFQDEDKELIGLIIYYGYIDDPTGAKKVFHTFPTPKKLDKEIDVKLAQRFDLSLLNQNEWFVETFGIIK